MSRLKERTIEIVVEGAADLFLEKSISAVTMEEIAQYVGVGAASMYRYFGTKQALAVKVAVLLAKNIYHEYFSNLSGKNGYEKLSSFYMAYYRIFQEKRGYYSFLREFDLVYLANVNEGKTEYESVIDIFYDEYQKLISEGVLDGTVKEDAGGEIFYLSTTHALLNLCKALSTTTALVSQDEKGNEKEQILMLIKIILNSLSQENVL